MAEMCTRYAPAERAAVEEVRRQARRLLSTALLPQLFDAMTEIVLILNPQRQIAYFNRRFAELAGIHDADALLGQRPGEALGCVHASEMPGGCGTTDFCSTCGAVNAIMVAVHGGTDIQECRILSHGGSEALSLLVRATPLDLDGESYIIFAVTDISHEKRRRILERVFFHDLMNEAVGLHILARAARPETAAEVTAQLDRGIGRLLEEIAAQRDLSSAENNDLQVRPAPLDARTVLTDMREGYAQMAAERGVRLDAEARGAAAAFRCDPSILSRVLGNMIKNAIEASADGQTVTLGCGRKGNAVEFRVHNAAFMPRDVQLQVFQRSFSTKGPGRGLGTYSMKLLAERYLGGRVGFETTEAGGTTFAVSLPLTTKG
jgi:signal transduction histidine kinase